MIGLIRDDCLNNLRQLAKVAGSIHTDMVAYLLTSPGNHGIRVRKRIAMGDEA